MYTDTNEILDTDNTEIDIEEENYPVEEGSSINGSEISNWCKQISQYPLLTPEEEYKLGIMLKGTKAERQEAIQKLVQHNLRYVINILKPIFGKLQDSEKMDLIQEGNMGLIRAAENFDVSMGVRFSTYSRYWIKQKIYRYLDDHSSLIRVPVHMTQNIRNFKKAQMRLQIKGAENTTENASTKLAFSDEQIRQIEEAQNIRKAISLETPISQEDDTSIGTFLKDNRDDMDTIMIKAEHQSLILAAMEDLQYKERIVIIRRFGLDGDKPATLKDIAEMLHLSRERIRQLELRSIHKMKFYFIRHHLALDDMLASG